MHMGRKTTNRHYIDKNVLIPAYNLALRYAERKLKRYIDTGLTSVIDASDVTNEAVKKTLSGERPWNPERCPDLQSHLVACIQSIISHTYMSSDFHKIDRAVNNEKVIADLVNDSLNHEEQFEFNSKAQFLLNYIACLKEDLSSTAEVMLRGGIYNPSEIASTLDLTASEVNSKRRSIRRLTEGRHLLLYYISQNRPDLNSIANAVLINKIVDVETISQQLGLPVGRAKQLRDDLNVLVCDFYRGLI